MGHDAGAELAVGEIASREALLAAVRSGCRPRYLYFWGHRPLPDGQIGRPCLSQWWPAPFVVDGVRYPSAEHYVVAEKARLFGDERARLHILATHDAAAAKQAGRLVEGFDQAVWEAERFGVVVRGIRAKFRQNEPLGRYLLATGDAVLVEASPLDAIWGIGMTAEDPRAADPEQWQGENLLGFALMTARTLIAREG